jgi:hypothetical protein
MQYLLIISHDKKFQPTEQLIGDIHTWINDMQKRGIRLQGNPLRPASEATTVRIRNGKATRNNGPFSNAAEQMCAYEVIECKNDDEAVTIASTHPMAHAATIEVRPIWRDLAA